VNAQKEVRTTNEKFLREYIYCHEQSGDRNMNVKSVFGEDSEGHGEHIILNWGKSDLI